VRDGGQGGGREDPIRRLTTNVAGGADKAITEEFLEESGNDDKLSIGKFGQIW
jgi:hypothetical protein